MGPDRNFLSFLTSNLPAQKSRNSATDLQRCHFKPEPYRFGRGLCRERLQSHTSIVRSSDEFQPRDGPLPQTGSGFHLGNKHEDDRLLTELVKVTPVRIADQYAVEHLDGSHSTFSEGLDAALAAAAPLYLALLNRYLGKGGIDFPVPNQQGRIARYSDLLYEL